MIMSDWQALLGYLEALEHNVNVLKKNIGALEDTHIHQVSTDIKQLSHVIDAQQHLRL